MSHDEIASVVTALADLLTVLRPADKAEIYTQLGLRLREAAVDCSLWRFAVPLSG